MSAGPVGPTGVVGCAQIETWRGGAWVAALDGTDRACSMTAPTLDSLAPMMGGAVVLDVPTGTYRVVQSFGLSGFEGPGFTTVAATAAFCVGEITPPDVPPASPGGRGAP